MRGGDQPCASAASGISKNARTKRIGTNADERCVCPRRHAASTPNPAPMLLPQDPVWRARVPEAHRNLIPPPVYSAEMMYVRPVSPPTRDAVDEPRPVLIDPEPLPAGGARLHDDPLLHALLARRVVDPEAAAEFLNPSRRPAPDPHLLPGMGEAVERIARALRRGTDRPFWRLRHRWRDLDGVADARLARGQRRGAAGRRPVAAAPGGVRPQHRRRRGAGRGRRLGAARR